MRDRWRAGARLGDSRRAGFRGRAWDALLQQRRGPGCL